MLRHPSLMATAVVLVLVAARSSSAEELKVFYAGFAFIGDSADVKTLYPHSYRISQEKVAGSGQTLLEKRLIEAARGATPPNYKFEYGDADLEKNQGLVLALALDRENATVEKIGDDYKIVFDLSAQILVVDFKNAISLVASFPIAIQLIDVSIGKEPDEEHLHRRFRELYLSDTHGGLNLVSEFQKTLNRQPIKTKYSNRIKVAKAEISEEFLSIMPEPLRRNPQMASILMGQLFSKYLSANQLVSVLPFTLGQAIGGKMTTRFANGSVYNLRVPEPDYEIDLSMLKVKKVEFDKKASATSWIYGIYVGVSAFQRELGKSYLDAKFKQAVTKVVPASQTTVDDWAAYYEASAQLFSGVTKQMNEHPSKNWIKSHTKDENSREGLTKMSEVLEKCR